MQKQIGMLHVNAEFRAMKSVVVSHVDQRQSFFTNCEETQNHLSKLSSSVAEHYVLAMVRGLRQGLSRIGCLQALEAGLTVEEPCPAEMASYDHVYCDEVKGALLPTNLSEEALQLEVKYMREMDVYTLCTQETLKEQGLTPIGIRWIFTNKSDTEHPLIRSRLEPQETKKTDDKDGPVGHINDFRGDSTCLRDFVFFSRAP